MQFYAYYANTPTTPPAKTWTYYANLVVSKATAQLNKRYEDFASGGSLYNGITFHRNAWCVDFVKWCCKEVGVFRDDIICDVSSSTYMRNWYRDQTNQIGTLHTGSSGIKAGDIVFYRGKCL